MESLDKRIEGQVKMIGDVEVTAKKYIDHVNMLQKNVTALAGHATDMYLHLNELQLLRDIRDGVVTVLSTENGRPINIQWV